MRAPNGATYALKLFQAISSHFPDGALVFGGLTWRALMVARGSQATQSAIGLGSTAGLRPTSPDPGDILKVRYARGEITPEQFREMRRDINFPEGPVS